MNGMRVYRTGNRMLMILDTGDNFDPRKEAEMDAVNIKVRECEKLMSQYKQPVPWTSEGEKWVAIIIFQLSNPCFIAGIATLIFGTNQLSVGSSVCCK